MIVSRRFASYVAATLLIGFIWLGIRITSRLAEAAFTSFGPRLLFECAMFVAAIVGLGELMLWCSRESTTMSDAMKVLNSR